MKKLLKNSKVELSIIIVNYNTRKLLSSCVSSVQKTTKNLKIEIVIVDNASTDRSMEGVKSTKIIKVILNSQNVGFAKAVNQGIKKSTNEYKLLLNPDTIIRAGAIKKLLEFAKATTDAGVIGAKLINPNGSIQNSAMHFPTLSHAVAEFWFGKKNAYSKYTPESYEPTTVDAVVGAAFLITPQALAKVGLLDERYFMYFEDLDYCRRIKAAGLKVYFLPTAEVVHYHGVSGKSLATEENQWRRLIPSSKIYHGLFKYYLLTIIIWLSQKIKK